MLDRQSRLGELESVIERGLTTFVEVGNAIREIRDGKLYKGSHDTFEKYCLERWGWKRRRAYQLVEAAVAVEAIQNVHHGAQIPNERVGREVAPLAKEDPETAGHVLNELIEEHGDSLTGAHTKKAVTDVFEAQEIRVQLPPKVQEALSDVPVTCSMPRNVAQMRHLKNISDKRGSESARETVERVGNGEFNSTFDAYPEIKGELQTKREKFEETAVSLKDPSLTPEQKAPRQMAQDLRAWERLDFDAVAQTTNTAEAAESLGYDADRLMAIGKLLKEACEKRRRELSYGRMEVVK